MQISQRNNSSRPSRAAMIHEFSGRLMVALKRVDRLSRDKVAGKEVSEQAYLDALCRARKARAQWGVAMLARF